MKKELKEMLEKKHELYSPTIKEDFVKHMSSAYLDFFLKTHEYDSTIDSIIYENFIKDMDMFRIMFTPLLNSINQIEKNEYDLKSDAEVVYEILTKYKNMLDDENYSFKEILNIAFFEEKMNKESKEFLDFFDKMR